MRVAFGVCMLGFVGCLFVLTLDVCCLWVGGVSSDASCGMFG